VTVPVILRAEAEADVRATHDALEHIQLGLGARFVKRLREELERVEAHPELYGVA
jgi:hypothetical protein